MGNGYVDEVRLTLDERKQEVDRHLHFAKTIIENKINALATVTPEGGADILSDYEVDRSLVKTISATGYLLIYNLLESTMTAALDAVHNHLDDEGLDFDSLDQKLQTIFLRSFQKASRSELIDKLNVDVINKLILSHGYDPKSHWSGNVDVKRIKEKARDYGFEYLYIKPDYDDVVRNISIVKDRRNELAHGELSFEQCGQGAPIDSLIESNNQVSNYLHVVLDGVDEYLTKERYRKAQFA